MPALQQNLFAVRAAAQEYLFDPVLKHSDEKFRRAAVRRYRNDNIVLFDILIESCNKQT
jgi:hypothetical protein